MSRPNSLVRWRIRRGQAVADRYSGAPVGSVLRVRAGKARERRSRGISTRLLWVGPGRDEAQGSIRRSGALNTCRTQGTLGRVKAQEPRSSGTGRRFGVGGTARGNGMWVHPARKRGGYLSRGEGSEGRNPRSAAGTKQGRHGLGRSKPPRG